MTMYIHNFEGYEMEIEVADEEYEKVFDIVNFFGGWMEDEQSRKERLEFEQDCKLHPCRYCSCHYADSPDSVATCHATECPM